MNSILVAAVAGAIGGVVGTAITSLIAKITGKDHKWAKLIPVVCIAIAVGIPRIINSPENQIMAVLDKVPTVSVIKTHYPVDYDALRAKVRALPDGATAIEGQNFIRPVISELIARQTPKADARNSYEIIALARDEARALLKHGPEACVGMLANGTVNVNLATALPKKMLARDMEVTSAMLKQTATHPAPPAQPMTEEAFTPFVQKAVSGMSDADRQTVAHISSTGQVPKTLEENRVMCAFNLALFDALLAAGPEQAGTVIRSFMVTK